MVPLRPIQRRLTERLSEMVCNCNQGITLELFRMCLVVLRTRLDGIIPFMFKEHEHPELCVCLDG
jgi:hypothetical protein